jgi:hypothetical protein
MSDPLAAALSRLHRSDGPVPASQFTPAQREALRGFLHRSQGAIRQSTQGRGAVYEIVRPDAIELELRRLLPGAVEPLPESITGRGRNIAQARNSKVGVQAHQRSYLLVKAVAPDAAWYSARKGRLDVAAWCRVAGAAALEIAPEDDWCTDQPLWLVENMAVFERMDWLPSGASGSLVYYGGNLTRLQLAWLARRQRTPEILHFPDYDGVGLQNYANLLEAAFDPVRLWLMPGWRDLLRRFGNSRIWQENRPRFDAVARNLAQRDPPLDPEVANLLQELRSSGLALEQEAVWLPAQGRG